MEPIVVAEASPCCPSPLVGQLLVMAYIVGAALTAIWMLFRLIRSVRYRRHLTVPGGRADE
jgi:hypothetical protein